MYRELEQVHVSGDEPNIPAGETRTWGPFTLNNTRAFLIQLKATQVPTDTVLKVYLSADFKPGTKLEPTPPGVADETAWTLIHQNNLLSATEPLIYEKCQTSAEWLRFRLVVGAASTLDNLDIVLAKQAWR